MDLFKAQLDRISKQLAGLSASQRMLAVTLVALMVITIYYWAHYAGTAEMAPVLESTPTAEDAVRIEQVLSQSGIPHTNSGGQILVPADRKMEAVADLMYSQALPHDNQALFEQMDKNANIFDSATVKNARYNIMLQGVLGQMMCQYWPNVATASVIINPKSEQRIEGSSIPSASVFIKTRSGSVSPKEMKQLVTSAAEAVASTVSDMTPGHVSVNVDGRPQHGMDTGESGVSSDDLMQAQQDQEEREEERIRKLFFYIPDLAVTVNCDVENSTKTEHTTAYDNGTTLAKDVETDERTTETHNAGSGGAEAGAGANTSASIAGSTPTPGGGIESTDSDTKTKTQIFPGQHSEEVTTPAGKGVVKSAAIFVPRSYFADIYKHGHPAATDPDDAALQPLITPELDKITTGVGKALGLKADALSVAMYVDTALASANLAPPAVDSPGMTLVTRHGKEIGIGVLAVLSLFMMSSMVRKATPVAIAAPSPVSESPTVLNGGEALAGEAGFSGSTLDGMELDEDSVRSQQMLDQVTTLVKENPDGAASLVKRWLNRN